MATTVRGLARLELATRLTDVHRSSLDNVFYAFGYRLARMTGAAAQSDARLLPMLDSSQHLFIIGAQKATTWLQHIFDTDSRFATTAEQEMFFFDHVSDQREVDYEALYRRIRPGQISVDNSSAYLTEPDVIDGINAYSHLFRTPPKVIGLLREPVSRAFSAYQMLLNYGRPYSDFLTALEDTANNTLQRKSLYAEHVRKWHAVFEGDRVRFFLYEDLRMDKRQLLDDIAAFLGVDHLTDYYGQRPINVGGMDRGKWLPMARRTVGRALRRGGFSRVFTASNVLE